MEDCIVWVYSICHHRPGYSAEWEQNFNAYLGLPLESYVEVVWETVFEPSRRRMRGRRLAGVPAGLTKQEQLAEEEVREQLKAILVARASAFQEAAAPTGPARRGRGSATQEVLEWS